MEHELDNTVKESRKGVKRTKRNGPDFIDTWKECTYALNELLAERTTLSRSSSALSTY